MKSEFVLLEGQGHWDCYKEKVIAVGTEEKLKEKLKKIK